MLSNDFMDLPSNNLLNYVVIVPMLMIRVDDFAAAHLVCSPAFFSQGPLFTGIERGISLTQEIYVVISQIGFSSVRAAVACAIFKRTSDLSRNLNHGLPCLLELFW